MKKLVFVILISIVMVILFTGCSGNFDEISIVASDVVDAKAGDYTLPYEITNYEKYRVEYNLKIDVKIYDENNSVVEVINNRKFTVELDKEYTVFVKVTGIIEGEVHQKNAVFTVKAERSPVDVIFMLVTEGLNKQLTKFTLPYGGTFDMNDLPEIPNIYPASDSTGYTEILSKKWIFEIPDAPDEELKAEHLTNITRKVYVYTHYEYNVTAITHEVIFDTDGGSEIEPVKGNANDILEQPTLPTKDGYVFAGWYTDKERTKRYDWRFFGTISANFTLYASWILNNESEASASKNFNFTEMTDDCGEKCYSVVAKDIAVLDRELVLPNTYNGIIVREVGEDAFRNSEITSVYIPNSYSDIRERAFFGCEQLSLVTFEEGSKMEYMTLGVFGSCISLKTITIPNSVKIIRPSAFFRCISLETITLPENLYSINKEAFYGCTSLKSITLPKSCVSVLEEAFYGCTQLSTFSVPEDTQLSSIYASTLEGTAVTEIKLPYILKEDNPFKDTNINVTFYDKIETEEEK